MPDLISSGQIEREYGISRQHLSRLVQRGKIKPVHDPGEERRARLFDRADIEELVKFYNRMSYGSQRYKWRELPPKKEGICENSK